MRQFDEKETAAVRIAAYNDLYWFSRWMFLQRRGYQWLQAAHHALICDALERVFNGETKRLIINIPPRYSKTELAVVNFIAWAIGRVPDSEFIHASYSATLAVNNAVNVRNLIQHEEYRAIFPMCNWLHKRRGIGRQRLAAWFTLRVRAARLQVSARASIGTVSAVVFLQMLRCGQNTV